MENLITENAMTSGLFISLFVGCFGLVWTVLERKLIVSRKHVTGTNGFTYTVVGACATAVCVYMTTDRIVPAACLLAAFIIAYALICCFVKKKEYSREEKYTKE